MSSLPAPRPLPVPLPLPSPHGHEHESQTPPLLFEGPPPYQQHQQQQQRPQRRSCMFCKASKTRCTSVDPDWVGPCARCIQQSLPCNLANQRRFIRRGQARDAPKTEHGPVMAASVPPHLALPGQSFTTEHELCVQAYGKLMHSTFPCVDPRVIRYAVFEANFSDDGQERARAFASLSSTWAAISLGATYLGKDPAPSLDMALQGLSEFYDYPISEIFTALIAIWEAAFDLKRTAVLVRCVHLLEALTLEVPVSSPNQFMCMRWIAKRMIIMTADPKAVSLYERLNLLDTTSFPQQVHVFQMLTQGMELCAFGGAVSIQDQRQRCQLASALFTQVMYSESVLYSEPSVPLMNLVLQLAHAYCHVRLERMFAAADCFAAALAVTDVFRGFLLSPKISFLFSMIVTALHKNGGFEQLVTKAKAHVKTLGKSGSVNFPSLHVWY